jgi:hypothetical protein
LKRTTQQLLYALARLLYGNRTTQYRIIEYRLPIVSIRTSVQIKGEQAFTDRKNNLVSGLADFYKNFNAAVDEKVFEQLIALYATKSPKQFYRKV